MKKLIFLLALTTTLYTCKNEAKTETVTTLERPEFSIIIHGGAGTILKKNMTPEKEAAYKAKLEEAISIGYNVLKDAAKEVIHDKVGGLGGDGGIVAVDKNGNMVAEFNTAGMYRATMNDKGELEVKIYKE